MFFSPHLFLSLRGRIEEWGKERREKERDQSRPCSHGGACLGICVKLISVKRELHKVELGNRGTYTVMSYPATPHKMTPMRLSTTVYEVAWIQLVELRYLTTLVCMLT